MFFVVIATLLIRKLTTGEGLPSGAMPCVSYRSLEDCVEEARGLNIQMAEVAA